MNNVDIDKLLKKREELIQKLQYFNNPPMFSTRNFEPHKKSALKRLHQISDTLHKELNVDKQYYRF